MINILIHVIVGILIAFVFLMGWFRTAGCKVKNEIEAQIEVGNSISGALLIGFALIAMAILVKF